MNDGRLVQLDHALQRPGGVRRGQRIAAVEDDAVLDLERVGPAVVGDLPALGDVAAQVRDVVDRVGDEAVVHVRGILGAGELERLGRIERDQVGDLERHDQGVLRRLGGRGCRSSAPGQRRRRARGVSAETSCLPDRRRAASGALITSRRSRTGRGLSSRQPSRLSRGDRIGSAAGYLSSWRERSNASLPRPMSGTSRRLISSDKRGGVMGEKTIVLAAALAMAPLGAKAPDLVVWWEEGQAAEEDAAVRDCRGLRAGQRQARRARPSARKTCGRSRGRDDPEVRRRLINAIASYTAIYRKGCTPPDSVTWDGYGNNARSWRRRS